MNFYEYLKYDPETGEIIWIAKPGKRIQVGQIAGTISYTGYLHIGLKGKLYKAHRLAWYLHYGVWPTNHIDHKNGIKTDNRILNLRDVTRSENQFNQNRHREKTVKYYGYHKVSKLWRVRKHINGKQTYFGCFNTEELARQFIINNIELFPGAKS